MDWLDLLAPSAAVLALFIAVALVVQSIRHGRAIRRIEDRLAQTGSAAVEASLERIQQLQTRATISSGAPRRPRGPLVRSAAIAVGVIVVLAAVGTSTWYVFLRDDDGGASANEIPGAATRPGQPVVPPDSSTVPDDLPPLRDKSLYDVAVLNATDVSGLAGDVISPRVENEGYTVTYIGDAPEKGLAVSAVMYARDQKRVGQNVADDLGIEDATPLDGLTDAQIGGADAVVLVGQDMANEAATTTTP
jgi:hypothetical protein